MEFVPKYPGSRYFNQLHLGDLQAVLSTPKVYLKKLEVSIASFAAMIIFATAVLTSLESIRIGCEFPPENAFNLLGSSNKCLRAVQIDTSISPEFDQNEEKRLILERVSEMTDCFLRSLALQSLVIKVAHPLFVVHYPGYFESFCEMLRTHNRHRRVRVHVFGYEFPENYPVAS